MKQTLIIVMFLACGFAMAATNVSNTISLMINSITGPASIDVLTGDPVNLTVVVGGNGPFSFVWKKNGSAMPGETSDTLSIASAAMTDTGSYSCTATSDGGLPIDSATATLTVHQRLTVTQDPVGMSKVQGSNGSFMVAAVGTAVSYQWQKYNTGSGLWEDIVGKTNPIYTLSNIQPGDAGNYRCHVSDTYGPQAADSSDAELVVIAAGVYPVLYLNYDPGSNANQILGHFNAHGYALADLLENPGSLPGGSTYASITAVGIKYVLSYSPFNVWEQDTILAGIPQDGNSAPDSLYSEIINGTDQLISQSLNCTIRTYFLIGGSRYYLKNATVKVNLTYGGTADLALSGNAWVLNLTAPLP